MNRIFTLSFGQILALLMAALMFCQGTNLAQAQAVPQPQTQQQSVSTEEPQRYDYKRTRDGGTDYYTVLKTKPEIDDKLQRERGISREHAELADKHWTVMTTRWRTDPVTSTPITTMPPTPEQQSELFEAIDNRLELALTASAK